MLLGGELLHQQVGVVDDETAEDQSPSSRHDQLCAVTVEEELQRDQSQREGEMRLTSLYSCTETLPAT